jgi:hypothetical protein
MSFDSTTKYSSRFGGLGDRASGHAKILKRSMLDGKIKVYEDETKKLERTEILVKEGTLNFNTEYIAVGSLARLKSIDIISLDSEPRATLDVITDSKTQLHPMYRFSYHGSPIGRGTGDVAMFIAQKLLGEENLDPRYVLGASVDPEVIEIITKLLQRKTV